MSHHREILAALQKLKSGQSSLSSEQYIAVLKAVEQASEALYVAPRGTDPVATRLWWHHERSPALARLADALARHPGPGTNGTRQIAALAGPAEPTDAEVIRALQQSLLNSPRRLRAPHD